MDGYIADADGSIAWLKPFDSVNYGFDEFMSRIGTVVMGRTTYEHLRTMGRWPHADKRCIVVTTRSMDTAPDNVEPWLGDLARLVAELRESKTGDVWVAGGAKALRAFMDLGAVERFDLFVMPLLLGRGRKLFEESDRTGRLTLLAAKTYINGVVRLSYAVG